MLVKNGTRGQVQVLRVNDSRGNGSIWFKRYVKLNFMMKWNATSIGGIFSLSMKHDRTSLLAVAQDILSCYSDPDHACLEL